MESRIHGDMYVRFGGRLAETYHRKVANNVPLQEVSAMLGHASTRMTQHYARVMDRNLKDNMNIVRSKMGL